MLRGTANLPTETLDIGGFDSGRSLVLRGGILTSIWNSPVHMEFPGSNHTLSRRGVETSGCLTCAARERKLGQDQILEALAEIARCGLVAA